MPRISWFLRLPMFGLAGLLFGQLPKPSPEELQRAQSLAALPADRAPAEISRMDAAHIPPGVVWALCTMSASEPGPAERERLARLAIELAARGGLTEPEGQAHFALADAMISEGDYLDAVENYGAAIQKFQQAASTASRICGAYGNRSVARSHLGDLQGALEDAQQALDLARQAGDSVRMARVYNALGNIYKDMGDYRRSLEVFEKALTIAREKGEKLGEAFILNNIGTVYIEQGDYPLAADYQLRSLKIKESLGKKNEAISTLIDLGDSYEAMGRRTEARRRLDEALRRAREAGLTQRTAEALKIMARLEINSGRSGRGIADLEEARTLFQKAGQHLDEAGILADLAHAQYDLRHYEESLTAAAEAHDLARQARGAAVLEDATLAMGQAYHAMRKLPEARAALAESIAAVEEIRENVGGAESERESYLAGHTDAYRELLSIDMEQHRPMDAFRLAEQSKGRSLLDLMRGGRPAFDRVMSAAERQRELSLRGRLAALRAQRGADGDSAASTGGRASELDTRIEKVRVELAEFRSSLYAAHPELRAARADVPAIAVPDAAELLSDTNAALLEYAVTPRRTYLFVIVHGPRGPILRTHVLPVEDRTLFAEVARAREQLASRAPAFVDRARKLCAWLITPAAPELAGKTSWIIVPDGDLWRLPFQALQRTDGRFLEQDAAIAYAPSLSVMHALLALRRTGSSKPRSLMVFADPSGDVPEADREAQAIAALYGDAASRVWRGAAATRDMFRARAPDFDVLHLAAHGVFDDRNPMSSHIILAPPPKGSREDGWVEAGEVRSMQLKPSLVILSGCETARGHFENGEGAVGLSWAFLAAGAKATVASQWRVESASTATLMVAFHRALLEGAGGAEALRRAGLKLLATDRFHHPFYWAGFELLGVW